MCYQLFTFDLNIIQMRFLIDIKTNQANNSLKPNTKQIYNR